MFTLILGVYSPDMSRLQLYIQTVMLCSTHVAIFAGNYLNGPLSMYWWIIINKLSIIWIVGLLNQATVTRHDIQLMHFNGRSSTFTLCMCDLNSPKNAPCSYAPKYTARLPTVWRDRPWPADIWRGVRTLRVGSRRDNIDERADRTQFSTFSEEANTIKTYNYCYLVHLFAQRPSSGAEGR